MCMITSQHTAYVLELDSNQSLLWAFTTCTILVPFSQQAESRLITRLFQALYKCINTEATVPKLAKEGFEYISTLLTQEHALKEDMPDQLCCLRFDQDCTMATRMDKS